jgi:dihydroxyacid dehydratase/phosphogluconate dehydratase
MAIAIEAMGLSLPYSSSTPAADPLKLAECKRAVEAIRVLLEKDIKPKDIMTRKAFENAITVVSNQLKLFVYTLNNFNRLMLLVVQLILYFI